MGRRSCNALASERKVAVSHASSWSKSLHLCPVHRERGEHQICLDSNWQHSLHCYYDSVRAELTRRPKQAVLAKGGPLPSQRDGPPPEAKPLQLESDLVAAC